MTLKAFLFLLVVTIVAVAAAATIAETFIAPGFERGIVIAVLSALVVFPAARWAEYRGWIKGDWSPGGDLRKAQAARREREAQAAASGAPDSGAPDGGAPDGGDPDRTAIDPGAAASPRQTLAGTDRDDSRAGPPSPPGDPR